MEETSKPKVIKIAPSTLTTVYEVAVKEEPEVNITKPNVSTDDGKSLESPDGKFLVPSEQHPIIYEIIEGGSRRGSDLLADNLGFIYSKKRESDVCVSWICSKRTKRKCHAMVKQKGDSFTRVSCRHTHPGDQGAAFRFRITRMVKEAAMQDFQATASQLVNDVLQHLTDAETQTLSIGFLQRMANRVRQPLRSKSPGSHTGIGKPAGKSLRQAAGDTVTYQVTLGGSKKRADFLTDSMGFTYRKKQASADSVTWSCTARHLKCRAVVSQRGDCFIRRGQDHNHPFGYSPLKQPRGGKAVKRQIRPVYSSDTSGSSTSQSLHTSEDERTTDRPEALSGRGCCVGGCGVSYSLHPEAVLLPLPNTEPWRSELIAALGWDRSVPPPKPTHICSRHFEQQCLQTQGGGLVEGSLPTKYLCPESPVGALPEGVVYRDLEGVKVAARRVSRPWGVCCTDTEVQLMVVEDCSVKLLVKVNAQLQASVWVLGIFHESRSIENTPLPQFLSRIAGRNVCQGVVFPELQQYASLPEPTLPYYRHVLNVSSPSGLTHVSTVRSAACRLLVGSKVCRPCCEVETILKKKKHAQDKAEFFQSQEQVSQDASTNVVG